MAWALNFEEGFIDAALKTALLGRQQLALHNVGDAATDVVLKHMEQLAAPEIWQALRVRIEHANGIVGANLERAKKLGIVATQPRPTAPYKLWQQASLPVAFGSDGGFVPWPSFQNITSSTNTNSISREAAIDFMTAKPAFAEFAETKKGRLMPGMVADIAVLSQNILTVPNAQLAETTSVLTIVGGQVAYAGVEFSEHKA